MPALQNILLYHAIGGKKSLLQLVHDSTTTTLQGNPVLAMTEGFKVRINGQRVDYPSLPASNGIIHPIEGVLLPPATDINIDSLVDVLALDGRFTTLIAAVTAAGLADTLATGGPFTVFAPTDDAFAALPPARSTRSWATFPRSKTFCSIMCWVNPNPHTNCSGSVRRKPCRARKWPFRSIAVVFSSTNPP